MRRTIQLFVISCLCAFVWALVAAEQVGTEKQIKETPPLLSAQKGKVFAGSNFELSWIKQGQRKFYWRTLTNRVAYLYNEGKQAPFIEITRYERSGIHDLTFTAGIDFTWKDAYGHIETSFAGEHLDFVYKSAVAAEFGHLLAKNLYAKLAYRYNHYKVNDLFIASPGLIYYFGNHYLSADYNTSIIESRDLAYWGTFKGNFALNKKLNLTLGAAIGERLYDIYNLKSSKQYSYIFFQGFSYKITKDLTLRLGYSYSMEKPAFIKRSVEWGLSLAF